VLIWVSSYGIIPSLLFGFCGRGKQLWRFLMVRVCGCEWAVAKDTSTDSGSSRPRPVGRRQQRHCGREEEEGDDRSLSEGSSNSLRPDGTGNSLYTVNSS
jgi:hypothetical protein